MRFLISTVVVLALALPLAACTSTAKSRLPCEECSYRVKPGDPKSKPATVYCVVNGKEVDCTKTPAECPECAKKMK